MADDQIPDSIMANKGPRQKMVYSKILEQRTGIDAARVHSPENHTPECSLDC
jgi:hypothetical protein